MIDLYHAAAADLIVAVMVQTELPTQHALLSPSSFPCLFLCDLAITPAFLSPYEQTSSYSGGPMTS